MARDIGHDTAIAAVAARQHGNVARWQLLDIGLTDEAIAHRVRTGRLFRVYKGVYAVGRRPRTPLERASAAVLACGPRAVLSHASAMSLWGFFEDWSTPFEVTVPTLRRPKGITTHRSTTLLPRDIRHHHGIPVTSPARALLDVAPRLSDRPLKRAVKRALVSPHMTEPQLRDVLARRPHHPGTKLLIPFVALSQTNVYVGGYKVDAWFPDHGLIVEIDSREYHLNPVSFETDRDRDTDTLLAGLATIRITPERIKKDPQKEADRLRSILEQLAARRRMSSDGPPPG